MIEGIQKYGLEWSKVAAHLKNTRTVDSLNKRWHSTIKHEESMRSLKEATEKKNKIKEGNSLSESEDSSMS